TVQALFAASGKRKSQPGRTFAPLVIAGLALAADLHLYSTGQALAVRADLPLVFHLALALLWWVAGDLIVHLPRTRNTSSTRHGLTGIAAGLLLLAAAATTERYDFGPWQIYPLAAVPVLAFASRLLLPALSRIQNAGLVILPTAFAVTTLLLASSAAADALRPWLFPERSAPQGRESHRLAAPGEAGGIVDGASRRLPREVDVRFRGQVMVQVKAHHPGLFRSWMESPLYVRTSTLTLFESDEVLSPIRSGRWRYDIDDGEEDHAIVLRDSKNRTAHLYSLYLSRESAERIPLLAGSETLFTEAVYEFADDWYQLSPPDEITRLRYTATAPLLAPLSDADVTRLLPRDRSRDSGIHLGLPPSPLAARVTGLTSRFDPVDPLGGIRRFLDEKTRYSLRFKTPEDSSPLESFLFGEGLGHCEHYAAATVLMLRSLGIASRVAYGYAGGIADPGKRILAFRDSDFHAWAEIRSPRGDDWIVFDTTPKSPATAARPPAAVTLPAIEEALYHDYSDYVAAPAESGFAFGEKIAELIALLSRHFFLTTGVGLALLAGFWRLLPGRTRKRPDSGKAAATAPAGAALPPEFLRELERVGERLGVPRKPGHTWREYLTRIAKVASPSDDLEAAVAYYYGVCYIGKARDRTAEDRFLLRVRQWHEAQRAMDPSHS
ncbi:MAG: DUF4129 domain-containing protein, partial [Verrucomicrobiaceae bacterium]|nr:DUF4129 domain-containing protein [Verrucomicrobiaceae bacterium]